MDNNYEDLQRAFGQNLRFLRDSKNLSLRDLAARCELDYSKISRIEAGKTNLKLSSLFELSKALEVDLKDLMDFDF